MAAPTSIASRPLSLARPADCEQKHPRACAWLGVSGRRTSPSLSRWGPESMGGRRLAHHHPSVHMARVQQENGGSPPPTRNKTLRATRLPSASPPLSLAVLALAVLALAVLTLAVLALSLSCCSRSRCVLVALFSLWRSVRSLARTSRQPRLAPPRPPAAVTRQRRRP